MEPAPDQPPPTITPAAPWSALVVAVPHAGRHYPALLDAAGVAPRALLERLADPHADRLIAGAVADGAAAVVARVARAWIDLNRAPDDVEGARASLRARSGLGLIPSRLNGRALHRTPPDAAAIAARVADVHAPYHRAVADALARARDAHGHALLVDCHSMPGLGGPAAAQVVVGDLHGRAAAAAVTAAAVGAAAATGLRVAVNRPYAGAHTLQRHGAPAAGIDALQIEFDRALYLDAAGRPTAAGTAAVAALFRAICRAALAAARPAALLAAE